MRAKINELLQDKLDSFVTEYLNDAAKNVVKCKNEWEDE